MLCRMGCLLVLLCTVSCGEEELFEWTPSLLSEDRTLDAQSEYIIVLGDIQTYMRYDYNLPYFRQTMDWNWSQNRYGINIKCVLQVGDVTQSNSVTQWERFYGCTAPIADRIPVVVCTGNHDYSWDGHGKIYDRSSTHINEYAAFPTTEANILARFEPDRIENIVVANDIQGAPYDVLVLEFGPRTEVLEWANDYVASRPERKFIVMTHEYLTRDGQRITAGSYAEKQLRNTTWSSPEEIWRTLVRDNDNIVCVLCGHNGFSARLFSENAAGRKVPQILFNLQTLENGGDGWVQLWEIPAQGDSISVSVYNTIRREYHPKSTTSFKFRYRY